MAGFFRFLFGGFRRRRDDYTALLMADLGLKH